MEASCRQALRLGLPAIAFTDHADFDGGGWPDHRPLDVAAYHQQIERCRHRFPELRILSGVELGHPHRFPAETAAILAAGPLDRVLGSAHCVERQGRLADTSLPGLLSAGSAEVFRDYLAEVLDLVRSPVPFSILAHLDYPKRYWPRSELAFREQDYEEEYRAVLEEAAGRGLTLELNTTRGRGPDCLCPGPTVLRWWVEAGGRSLSFGSDAHEPGMIARGFELAAEVAEAVGFRPNPDPTGFWLR
jgi:histidinol-phosphatase (PHP family)